VFGMQTLDVVIGIAVVFFLFSLLVSAVREAIEAVIKARAVHLERGIRELLDDADGTGLATQLYRHPQLFALYRGRFESKLKRFRGGGLPTYVPARQFATALLDLVAHGPVPEAGTPEAHYDAERTHARIDVDALRAGIRRMASPLVRRAILNAIDQSTGDLESIRGNVETWFNGTMDRVSGWYKRNTQYWLFGIGVVLAVAMNVNTLSIAEYLSQNETARNALVERARTISESEAAVKAPLEPGDDAALGASAVSPETATRRVENARKQADTFRSELAATSIPIGWDRLNVPPPCVVDDTDDRVRGLATRLLAAGQTCRSAAWYVRQLFGLLLTAVAACLGAPFWFDLLNKVMVIRSTVKPREKSHEEGSEDRRPAPSAAPPDRGQTVAAAPSPVVAAQAGSAGATPATPVPGDDRPSTDEPHQWAEGPADEGIL